MKIIFNTVIDLETLQKMEAYIEKALQEAEQDQKQPMLGKGCQSSDSQPQPEC